MARRVLWSPASKVNTSEGPREAETLASAQRRSICTLSTQTQHSYRLISALAFRRARLGLSQITCSRQNVSRRILQAGRTDGRTERAGNKGGKRPHDVSSSSRAARGADGTCGAGKPLRTEQALRTGVASISLGVADSADQSRTVRQ